MSKRKQNPLLSDTFWPEFLRKQLQTRGRHRAYQQLQFPMMARTKEQAFLREEEKESWRRMLFQQPPTSCLGIIETMVNSDSPWFSRTQTMPRQDYIRVEDVYRAVQAGPLMPCQDQWLFWHDPYYLNISEREFQDERATASNYLQGCDLVIFTMTCRFIKGHTEPYSDLDRWIVLLDKFKRDKSCWNLHMWNFQNPCSGRISVKQSVTLV